MLNVIERDGLLEHVTAMGEHLVRTVEGLHHPLVAEVRGRGLLRGIVLTADVAPAVADLALEAGFVDQRPASARAAAGAAAHRHRGPARHVHRGAARVPRRRGPDGGAS